MSEIFCFQSIVKTKAEPDLIQAAGGFASNPNFGKDSEKIDSLSHKTALCNVLLKIDAVK